MSSGCCQRHKAKHLSHFSQNTDGVSSIIHLVAVLLHSRRLVPYPNLVVPEDAQLALCDGPTIVAVFNHGRALTTFTATSPHVSPREFFIIHARVALCLTNRAETQSSDASTRSWREFDEDIRLLGSNKGSILICGDGMGFLSVHPASLEDGLH